MASSSNSLSQKDQIIHKSNKLCDDCSFKILNFYRRLIFFFFQKVNDFVQKDQIKIFDATQMKDIIQDFQNDSFGIFKEENKNDKLIVDYEKYKETQTIKILDVTIIKAPYFGKQKPNSLAFKNLCEVYFIIENISYIDIQIINQFFKMFSFFYEFEKNSVKKMIFFECCKQSPRLILEDIILHTSETFLMKKKCRNISAEIRGILYNYDASKEINIIPSLSIKLDNIIDNSLQIYSNKFIKKTIIEIDQNDIKDLQSNVKNWFSETIDDEIIHYDSRIIYCRNPKFQSFDASIDHTILRKVKNIIDYCDIILCINDCNSIYISLLIDKYEKLFEKNNKLYNSKHHKTKSWKLTYIGINKNIHIKSLSDCDDLIVGLCIKQEEREDSALLSSSSSTSITKKKNTHPIVTKRYPSEPLKLSIKKHKK